MVKQPLKTEWCLDENQVIPSQYFNNDDDVEENWRGIDLLILQGVGGGGGDEREDDNPGRPNLPTPTGAGSLDEPPG